MIGENPQVKVILQKIANVDWYFANVMEREIKKLDWCITGKLIKVNTEDRDSISTPVTQNAEQVAIRMLESTEVYLDDSLFSTLSDNSKAFLILHETLHSLLNIDETLRNKKLRSTVKTLNRITTGEIKTRKDFYFQIQKNGIKYPALTGAVDPIKNYILFVFGDDSTRAEVLAKAGNINSLVPSENEFKQALLGLTEEDAKTVQKVTAMNLIDELCSGNTNSNLNQLLPKMNESALMVCMNSSRGNIDVQTKIASLPKFQNWIQSLLKDLSEKSISKEHLSLKIQSVAATMSANDTNEDKIMLTSLEGINQYNWNKLNPSGRAFYEYVKTLLRNNDRLKLDQMLQNPLFYKAFSFEMIKTQLSTIVTDIPREKRLAETIIKEYSQNFWETFLVNLGNEIGIENANTFKSKLDQTKLGIKI